MMLPSRKSFGLKSISFSWREGGTRQYDTGILEGQRFVWKWREKASDRERQRERQSEGKWKRKRKNERDSRRKKENECFPQEVAAVRLDERVYCMDLKKVFFSLSLSEYFLILFYF
jgi:hypothetical protein